MTFPEKINILFNMLLDMVPIRLPECDHCGAPMVYGRGLCEDCCWDLMCGGLNPHKRKDDD